MTTHLQPVAPEQESGQKPATKPVTKRRKADVWPRHVKADACRFAVTVYRRVRASGKVGFMVNNTSNGGRVLESFEDEGLAIARAEDLSRLLSNRQSLAGGLSNQDAVTFAAARDLLDRHGIPMLPAVETLVAAWEKVGSLPAILEAARNHAQRNPRNLKPKSVQEAVLECVEEKERGGASRRYVEDLRSRLGQFAAAFQCDVGAVTGAAIQDWLDRKELSPQSVRNFGRVLHGFVQFCIRREYLPKGWDELDRLARPKIKRTKDVSTYSPTEFGAMLQAASPAFLPSLVLQGFCGVRSAECERLQWQDLNLQTREVIIGSGVAKTASRRVCPLPDAAVEWLAPLVKERGRVWDGTHEGFYDAQAETAEKAGVEWRHNALRHSAISAKLAVSGDVAKTAYESGNSASVVHSHYKSLMPAKTAKDWFSIRPETGANVVPMRKTA